MKKIFINDRYEYDYEFIINNDGVEIHRLYYSNNGWHEVIQNTLACELIDNGNGIESGLLFKGNLDYSDFQQLVIISNLKYTSDKLTHEEIKIYDEGIKLI